MKRPPPSSPSRRMKAVRKSSIRSQAPSAAASASELIDARIRDLADWRGDMLSHIRGLVREADAAAIEEWKWRGVPVWSHDGIICTCETYKEVVKITFAKGASLSDPRGLFNASLEGGTRRAIDLCKGEKVNAAAFRALIRRAVAVNAASRAIRKDRA